MNTNIKGPVTPTAAVCDIGNVYARDLYENFATDERHGIPAMCPGLTPVDCMAVCKRLWEKYAYLPAGPGKGWREMEREYWGEFLRLVKGQFTARVNVDDFITMTDRFVLPVEGALALLEELRAANIRLAVCSNNTEFWFARQADKLDLHRFFSPATTILSCRVGAPKSSQRYEMFHAVSDALGVAPASCVFIDDRKGNVERARLFGMQTILCVDSNIAVVREGLVALGVL